jgi:ADP-heptose:LPS heptosyltransferase
MLSTMDTRKARFRERLTTLNTIKRQYKLSFDVFRRIKSALNYDH